jgi:sugar lactone lactonase YvrE
MKVEQNRERLWVAGGPTGHAYVYSTRDGSPVADLVLTPGPSFINDVVVTKGGAYFTDSVNPVLYKVPIAPDGRIGVPQSIPLSGPAATISGQFNNNGITATPNGEVLIVGHSALGAVITVDPQTGSSQTIAITGGTITPGTPDGILLDGKTLWVVENFAERLVKIQLSSDLTSGRITAAVTSDLFRIPTTVAEDGDRLAIVNARFDVGLPPPLGTGVPPGTDYNVVQLQKP